MTVFRNVRLLDYFDNRCDRGTRLTKAERLPGTVPLVTAGVENKGVARYIAHNKQLFDKDSITIDMFGNTFYRNYEFYADDNILVLHKQVYSKNILLYFTGAISQATYGRFSYSKQFRQKVLQNLIVSLPFTGSGQLDVQYMEQYIKRVEADYTKRVEADYTKRVEAYLATLGYESLDDCELSSQDLKVLSGPDKWGEFRLGSMFTRFTVNGPGSNLAMYRSDDSGYFAYGQNIKHKYDYKLKLPDNYLYDFKRPVIMFATSTGQISVVNEPFYCANSHAILEVLDLRNKLDSSRRSLRMILYLITAVKRVFGRYSWKSSVTGIDTLKIKLPVTPDGKPDYDFMDQYITAIEKKKVLKLKQAMDHKLDLYQEVNHQN